MRLRSEILALLVACCPPPPAATPHAGSNEGSAVVPANGCEAARAKVDALYRADATTREPKRIDEATADNVAMVMKECAKAPDKVAPCLANVLTTADLESACLKPLDEEGTEGDASHP